MENRTHVEVQLISFPASFKLKSGLAYDVAYKSEYVGTAFKQSQLFDGASIWDNKTFTPV